MPEKILIIEDDPAIAAIERDYLELSGYEVTHCADGTEGLRTALEGPWDLLLLDLMLPGTDGFAICRVEVRIRDDVQLKNLMNKLNQISGVLRVTRPAG